MAQKLERITAAAAGRTGSLSNRLAWLREDPVRFLANRTADPWQAQLLRQPASRTLLLAGRQVGKSLTAAALALECALLSPGALVLLLSPSLRQSAELFRDKVLKLFRELGEPVRQRRPNDPALRLELVNQSRIISLPSSEPTIRGFSGVALLVIDEAARVSDALYFSIRPMLATSGGRLVALSTAYGKAGWFFEAFLGTEPWERVKITADQCGRIPRAFLDEERRTMSERLYRREYLCEFSDADDSVFRSEDIAAAFSDRIEPLEI
jgi:hypothetical protein